MKAERLLLRTEHSALALVPGTRAKTVARHRATTIINALAGTDGSYTHRGLGPRPRREAPVYNTQN